MGVQLIHRARIQQIKMKSLLVFAVVVLAVNCGPEADPALLLAGYGYGYGYPLVYGHPYSLGLGCFNDAGESVPCAGRKRREAEAEADPAYLLAGSLRISSSLHCWLRMSQRRRFARPLRRRKEEAFC